MNKMVFVLMIFVNVMLGIGHCLANTNSSSKGIAGIIQLVLTDSNTQADLPPMSNTLIYDLSGKQGVIVCFHGTGGRADNWGAAESENLLFLTELLSEGWSYVCPSSIDRSGDARWSNINNAMNPDVIAVDQLLSDLNIPSETPLILVGHSFGVAFANRFVLLSDRSKDVVAAQYSNAAGIGLIFSSDLYLTPTLFNYAECDPIIDYQEVVDNSQLLADRGIAMLLNPLDEEYLAGSFRDCHQFLNTGNKILQLISE